MSESPAVQPAAPLSPDEHGLSEHPYLLGDALLAASTQDEVLWAVLRCALRPAGALAGAAPMV